MGWGSSTLQGQGLGGGGGRESAPPQLLWGPGLEGRKMTNTSPDARVVHPSAPHRPLAPPPPPEEPLRSSSEKDVLGGGGRIRRVRVMTPLPRWSIGWHFRSRP